MVAVVTERERPASQGSLNVCRDFNSTPGIGTGSEGPGINSTGRKGKPYSWLLVNAASQKATIDNENFASNETGRFRRKKDRCSG
jgi:hypothetical protein